MIGVLIALEMACLITKFLQQGEDFGYNLLGANLFLYWALCCHGAADGKGDLAIPFLMASGFLYVLALIRFALSDNP